MATRAAGRTDVAWTRGAGRQNGGLGYGRRGLRTWFFPHGTPAESPRCEQAQAATETRDYMMKDLQREKPAAQGWRKSGPDEVPHAYGIEIIEKLPPRAERIATQQTFWKPTRIHWR